MAILKFKGTVSTDKVGSECEFEFEVDEDDLPEDAEERKATIHEIGLEALWESGVLDWGYEQVEGEE